MDSKKGWSCIMEYIENKEIKVIKRILWYIYALNVTDIIFTLLLLRTGLFIEANVLMQNLVTNEALSLAVKIIVPLVTVLYVSHSFDTRPTTFKVFKTSKFCLSVTLGIYVFINIMHIFYLLMTYGFILYFA